MGFFNYQALPNRRIPVIGKTLSMSMIVIVFLLVLSSLALINDQPKNIFWTLVNIDAHDTTVYTRVS